MRRYRQDYLDRLRGNAPEPQTQGVPVVPLAEPDDQILEFQRRFAALSEQGRFHTLSEDEEFLAIVAGNSTSFSHGQRELLEDVRRQILGDPFSDLSGATARVNPAHLSGLGNADFAPAAYDEHLMGPQTTAVPVGTGGAQQEPTREAEVSPAPVRAAEAAGAEDAATAGTSRPVAAAIEPEDPERADTPEGSQATAPAPEDSGEPTPTVHHADARPVRAVDAHGLDLSGMDAKAQGRSGRTWLYVLLAVLVIAVVLGIVFLLP